MRKYILKAEAFCKILNVGRIIAAVGLLSSLVALSVKSIPAFTTDNYFAIHGGHVLGYTLTGLYLHLIYANLQNAIIKFKKTAREYNALDKTYSDIPAKKKSVYVSLWVRFAFYVIGVSFMGYALAVNLFDFANTYSINLQAFFGGLGLLCAANILQNALIKIKIKGLDNAKR